MTNLVQAVDAILADLGQVRAELSDAPIAKLTAERDAALEDAGNLHRFLDFETKQNQHHAECNREALATLGITYPGLCNDKVWGGGIVEGIKQVITERDAARAEAEMMRPVFLWATKWRIISRAQGSEAAARALYQALHALEAAIDAASAGTEEEITRTSMDAAARKVKP